MKTKTGIGKRVGWVNLYKTLYLNEIHTVLFKKSIYESEEDAKNDVCSNHIATVKIEWEE